MRIGHCFEIDRSPTSVERFLTAPAHGRVTASRPAGYGSCTLFGRARMPPQSQHDTSPAIGPGGVAPARGHDGVPRPGRGALRPRELLHRRPSGEPAASRGTRGAGRTPHRGPAAVAGRDHHRRRVPGGNQLRGATGAALFGEPQLEKRRRPESRRWSIGIARTRFDTSLSSVAPSACCSWRGRFTSTSTPTSAPASARSARCSSATWR